MCKWSRCGIISQLMGKGERVRRLKIKELLFDGGARPKEALSGVIITDLNDLA